MLDRIATAELQLEPTPSPGALRTRRWREKKAEERKLREIPHQLNKTPINSMATPTTTWKILGPARAQIAIRNVTKRHRASHRTRDAA